MNKVLNDDPPLRRYLLGELSPAEELKIEERLIVDSDYMEQLEVAEDELIDSYAAGELNSHERENFRKHFLVSIERQHKLRLAKALIRHTDQRMAAASAAQVGHLPQFMAKVSAWMLKPAFSVGLAVLVLAGVAVLYWGLSSQSDLRKGLQSLNDAYSQGRPLNSRITALNYAPFSVKRGDDQGALSSQARVALDRAARIFLDLVSEKPKPSSYHAAGRYYLTQRQYDQAINQFNLAFNSDKAGSRLDRNQKAQLHSDYAVALMERAKNEKKDDPVRYERDMAESDDHLHEALKSTPAQPEPLFNRGLWLQERKLWKQAEETWNKYLEIDSSSRWAEEAKRYRETAIEEGKKQVSLAPPELLNNFLEAYRNNDKEKAWRVISNREPITGRVVWWQLTEAFLNAANNGQKDKADDLLQALSYAGELELRKGDHFTSQLARFYRSLSPQQSSLIAKAHEHTNQGNALCVSAKYADAFDHYKRANEIFRQARDELEAIVTDYWIGYYYYQTTDLKQSLSVLNQLAATCKRENYLSLLSQTYNTLASVHFSFTEYSKSNEVTEKALAIAEQLDDAYGIQKNLAQLANQHKYLDDFNQALIFLHRCLASSENGWPGFRQMWRTNDTIAQVFNGLHFYAAAADYQREALSISLKYYQDPTHISVSYAQLASIYSKLKDHDEAIKLAQLGLETSRSASPRMVAYSLLGLGHLYREAGDYRQALAYYDQATSGFEKLHEEVRIYSAYKGRLLCYLAQRNDKAVEENLQKVLELANKYRANIFKERQRNIFFDAEQSVYDIAIGYEYSWKGDAKASFDYSEVSRARSLLDLIGSSSGSSGSKDRSSALLSSVIEPLKLNEVQARLPEETQILQYAVLEDKLLIWVISRTGFDLVEKNIGQSELQEKALAYWRLVAQTSQTREDEAQIAQQARALYQILIAPVESKNLLDRNKTICVVPDKALNYLPFNALINPQTAKFLVNEYRLTFAPSSTVFLICSEWARQRNGNIKERLLSVGNPSFNLEKYPELPASEREVNKIAKYYRDSKVLLGPNAKEATIKGLLNRYDVIHLASHYDVDDHSPMFSKLLLAQEPDESRNGNQQDGMLYGEEIYQMAPLHARLVILSACRSGVERYYNGEGMIGMSRTFIASDVPLVVASLWQVDSEATAELMVNFHRYRKQEGCSTAEALRRAQLEMSSSSQWFSGPTHWASFIVIGGYANF